ncbi:MAG: hypothetical protein GY950_26825 [bacterium]|nr:hypothetical protein [bacterium]
MDVFARSAAVGDYSIIGEVKSREAGKFSKEEAEVFAGKTVSPAVKMRNGWKNNVTGQGMGRCPRNLSIHLTGSWCPN